MLHNADNIETLAQKVVDDMDLDDLMAVALETITNNYLEDEELFNEDWAIHMEEE